ncbi:T9SS type A sorting domain-containing protein [Yeosuana sp. MJ-SS3]|uniref:T9SS type A sorting domain-containing protein n=1 Tax=Gilvirhabdus luticola TaxID=3079858 RepID=A0ABU3U2Y3_9FLAO|nr:T9SS type A sorting domain-containing protein [Yeosuana sp. MJ-SS3]MDU8884697.1 T9SS type A sorting domain-containing protein [Yeosuana sp. MJ-SS3]
MKKPFLLLLSIMIWSVGSSQIVFDEHILAETLEQAIDVYAFDIDGDGDLDLLGNESYGHILWFKNTDGLGDFSEAITIEKLGYSVVDTFTSDLDGDGDQDVIIATSGGIHWFENMDGEGTFSTLIDIGTGWGGGSAFAADLDDDGDMDIIAGYYDDLFGSLQWYKNDGFGNFTDGIAMPSDRLVIDVLAIDIDNDNDLDLCTTSYFSAGPGGTSSHTVGWYENTDGLGTFSTQNVFSTGSGRIGDVIRSTDLDGDGDPDILIGGEGTLGDQVIWFENLDGMGTFGPERVIAVDLEKLYIHGIHINDVDADGDMDVIASWDDGIGYGEIVWYENIDGRRNFGYKQIVTSTCEYGGSIYSGDFDGDGYIDVFGASLDKFTWYENSLILGNIDFDTSRFSIYPNPAKDQFTISLNKGIELDHVNIYNQLGQLISSTHETTVSNLGLSSGMYYVEIIKNTGKATNKIVIE